MNRLSQLTALAASALAVLASAALAAPSAEHTDRPPNFVFVLVDDFGWMDVGYNCSTFYETPRIDEFSKLGMRFNRPYASSPMYSPTRVSIMTGRSPARTGVTQYIFGWRSCKPTSQR